MWRKRFRHSNQKLKRRLWATFSTWSLRVLAGYISKEINLVDTISHTEIRNILLKHEIRYRQSKITLGNSQGPEYHLKKRGLKT
jgi:hypothetical protein